MNSGGWAERFTVIGAGKTGLDACLRLLHHGVDPDRITWITPRDAWMINRDQESPLSRFGELTKLLACNSVDDVISALEQMDLIIRRDPYVRPSAFRCATVSAAELAQLRKIEHVVRPGRARRIDSAGVRLDEGSVQSPPGTVYIDCSADGLTQQPPHSARPAVLLRHTLERLHRWSGSPALFEWLLGSRLGSALSDLQQMTDQDNRAAVSLLASHLEDLLKRDGVSA
ncbi:hypothetical protein ACIBVL_25250 [Streptomyces sp. NPDC049687]|uniref:hypothetical protein n=1 Tax=Streptomyces sp. NPDC049687 TaxID=3365596 RepID=UPI0037B5F1C6